MHFDDRELATVLAALRLFQRQYPDPADAAEEFPHFKETAALSPDEVDDLCERLNAGGVTDGRDDFAREDD